MDVFKDYALWLVGAGGLLLLPLAWNLAASYIAKKADEYFAQLIDLLLTWGDAEWDDILLRVVGKIEKEIPDGLRDDHPRLLYAAFEVSKRIPFFKGKEKHLAALFARVFRAVDKRAKKYRK